MEMATVAGHATLAVKVRALELQDGQGPIAFRVLGPLEVNGGTGPVRVPPGRQEIVLAALLLEVNRVVGSEHLVDLIWDEEPPDTARTQVQICVSRLRKSF